MNNCLLIMNARDIPECISAFNKLNITKVWFRGFTEGQLEIVINNYIKATKFDNYIWASDDLIPRQLELDAIELGLINYPIVTGYSNMNPQSTRVNVRTYPFVGNLLTFIAVHGFVQISKYTEMLKFDTFPTLDDILKTKSSYFRTYFMGASFTGMRRFIWQKIPFKAERNPITKKTFGSDWSLSKRLYSKGYIMMAARDGFFYHLNSRQNIIVGKVKPQVIEGNLNLQEVGIKKLV